MARRGLRLASGDDRAVRRIACHAVPIGCSQDKLRETHRTGVGAGVSITTGETLDRGVLALLSQSDLNHGNKYGSPRVE